MVQSEMRMISKGPKLDVTMAPEINMFNEYFGSGLSSIVFQEIRESKALAYSAYSYFSLPSREDRSHYVQAYIGAQVDKLPEATDAMLEIMNKIPKAEMQFEGARNAAMKKIETNRTSPRSLFWNYETAKRRGIDYDLNRVVYDSLQTMKFDDLEDFFNQNIAGKDYTYCVIGNKEMVDRKVLGKLGVVRQLSLEELFGYKQKADGSEALVKN
jgi:predicted Zn-dependent peptidase